MWFSEGIGSLLRPPYLAEARARVERGDLSPAEFKQIEDRAVDEAVALQETADLVDVTRREIEELRRLGCGYIQIDAPQYAALLDESIREGYRQRGSDPDRMLDACIDLDNAIIDGHKGVVFGIHICRGNYRSMF